MTHIIQFQQSDSCSKKISQLFILDDVLNENGFELNLKNSNASKECGNRDTPKKKELDKKNYMG